jgi:uncharacterized membrane protein YkvA (DUF1232 family)
MFAKIKLRAQELKREVRTLAIALRDRRTPWYAKTLIGLVLAYVVSPVDLIPDFIPVFGYLDDLLVVSGGIALTLKLIPADVLSDARKKSTQTKRDSKTKE